jgi:hypothetical protein
MSTKDVSESPKNPQFQLGATTDEAETYVSLTRNNIPGPGGIVERLGHQFQMPRASVDSEINRDTHGED